MTEVSGYSSWTTDPWEKPMRTSTRAAAALLTTTIVIAGTAATANAEAVTIKDRATDVLTYSDGDQGTRLGYSDSVASGADIRSLKVNYSKKSLTLRFTFAELGPDTTISGAIRLRGKKRPAFGLIGTSPHTVGVYTLKGKKACSARVSSRTGTKGWVKVVVKRSCLKNPQEIQVAANSEANVSTADSYAFNYDAVSKSNIRNPTWTRFLSAG